VYPDTGDFSFHTSGWSAISSFIHPPSSFAVSVYPNPSNGTIVIEGQTDRTRPRSLIVFNIMGQEITRLPVPPGPSGRYRIHWNLEDAHGHTVSTGAYFIQPESAQPGRAARVSILR
jgi:hypothetical protein